MKVEDFNTTISINRISEDIKDLNTFNQLKQTYIYRMPSPTTSDYTFL